MEWILAGIPLVLLIVIASVLFFVALFVGIFWLVGRMNARIAEGIAREGGVLLRTGPQWVSARFVGYRSERYYFSRKISKNRGEALLTERALVFVLGIVVLRFANVDLAAAEVSLDGDRLRFKTSKPTDATGDVELALRTPDNAAWKRALVERGARDA